MSNFMTGYLLIGAFVAFLGSLIISADCFECLSELRDYIKQGRKEMVYAITIVMIAWPVYAISFVVIGLKETFTGMKRTEP